MILPAISGARLSSRKTLSCTMISPKSGVRDRTATAMAKVGTSARSVVNARLPAICGQRSRDQRRNTNRQKSSATSRRRRMAERTGYDISNMREVLVLYYSATGAVRSLAQSVARGVDSVEGMRARVRTVPKVAPVVEKAQPAVPPEGAPYVEARDLEECVAVALGSPTRFGNMAAPLKYFIDGLGAEWNRGTLSGKPAAVFSSSASMHGGQETTLVSMMM